LRQVPDYPRLPVRAGDAQEGKILPAINVEVPMPKVKEPKTDKVGDD
jgi:hypothetical protein